MRYWRLNLLLCLAAVLIPVALGQPASPDGQSQNRELGEDTALIQEQLAKQQKEIVALREMVQEQAELIRILSERLPEKTDFAESTSGMSVAPAVSTPHSAPTVAVATLASSADRSAAPQAAVDQGLRYKNFRLTPGGFVEATGVLRSRNQNADVGETFGNIPLTGTANSHLSSFRASARHSRLSLRTDGEVSGAKITGYFEGDFLGSSTTANEVESNDFPMRVRQFWGDVAFANGLSFTAGQTWTLLTTHQQGLKPLNEYLTLALSAQHVVGFNWARQATFRVTKDFGNGLWTAVSVENPETNVAGVVLPEGILGLNTSPNAQVPGATFATSLTPGANGISTDLAPDVVGKVVFEPGWGHYEVKALGRWFRSRLNGQNYSAFGGGLGGAAILPVHRDVDLLVEGLVGPGIGRYAAAVGPDIAIRPDGGVQPIWTAQAITGFDWRPSPRWQIYNYFGLEYYDRTTFGATSVGYGSPTVDLSECIQERTLVCPGANRNVWQIMPGLWYSLLHGEQGNLSLGLSYIHTRRQLWSGQNGLEPQGKGNSFMTSVRFYLP